MSVPLCRLPVTVKCVTCGKFFETKKRNLARGGGKYCSRACNPVKPKFGKDKEAVKKHRQRMVYTYGPGAGEKYDELLKLQKGCCAICGKVPERLFLDHCHKSGKVRGLLCQQCNTGIGMLQDSLKLIRKAEVYLRRHMSGSQE